MLYPNNTSDSASHPPAQVDPTGFGKTAIVTGCASGIGLATTQLLLAHQFSVCGLDLVGFDYRMFFFCFDSLFFREVFVEEGCGVCEELLSLIVCVRG